MPLSARELRRTPSFRKYSVIHSKWDSKNREDFLKGLRMALIPRHLFQAVQRRAGLLFVLTVFEDVPDTTQEGAQATDLLIGLDDLDQALLFFGDSFAFRP